MASVTHRDMHVDAALSALSVGYRAGPTFIAEQIAPRVRVGKESDKYFKFGKDNLRVGKSFRANGTPAAEVSYSLSTDSYTVDEHAYEGVVTDRDVRQADAPLDPAMDMTDNLTDRLLTDLEKDVAGVMTDSAQLTKGETLSGTSQWSDYNASDPLKDFETGKASVRKNVGRRANLVVMGDAVWQKLRQHPDIIDRLKHTQLGVATEALLAQLIGVDRVLIGDSIENTAAEGATDVLADIWGKHAVVAYVNPNPGRRVVSLGYLFSTQDRRVERYRDEKVSGDRVRVSDFWGLKIVAADAGYLIKDAVA